MNDILDWLLASVQSVDPLLRAVLAGVAIMLETSILVGLVMPGDTVVLIASTGLEPGNVPDFVTLLGFVLVGSLIGETIGFFIGRLFGERNWQMADAFIETKGGLAVAISRFLPVLHSVVPVTAGMSRMSYRTFIRWTFAACAIWALAYVSIGVAAHGAYDQLSGQLKWAGVAFVAIILIFIIFVHFAKQLLERKAAAMIAKAEDASPVKDSTQETSPELPSDLPERNSL